MKTYFKVAGVIGIYLVALHPVYERGWTAAMEFAKTQNAQGQAVYAVPVVEKDGDVFMVDFHHGRLRKVEKNRSMLEQAIDASDKFFSRLLPDDAFD